MDSNKTTILEILKNLKSDDPVENFILLKISENIDVIMNHVRPILVKGGKVFSISTSPMTYDTNIPCIDMRISFGMLDNSMKYVDIASSLTKFFVGQIGKW